MAETGTSLAYRALLSFAQAEVKILGSAEVASTAKKLGFNPKIIQNSLVRGGYLLPAYFRGIYCLLDPDEFKTKFLKKKPLEIIAAACSRRFGRNWYYGLSTALYLGGMQNQAPKEFFIITDRHLPASFGFGGSAFRVRKSSARDYSLGIQERGFLRFSSPARTAADYLYFHAKEGRLGYAIGLVRGMAGSFPGRFGIGRELAGIYPPPYNIAVEHAAKKVRSGNV